MNSNYYGMLVEKYGKWKINTKERMLVFSQEGLSYYPLPDDKELVQNFRNIRNEIRNNDNKNFQELLQRANITNEMKEKFPKEKQKGFISYKNMEYKIEDEDRRVVFVDKSLEKEKDKEKIKDKKNEWDCLINQNELVIIGKFKKEFDVNKNKNEKDDNKGQKKADESQNNKTSTQNNQLTNFKFLQSLETIYQILWDEYYKEKFNSSKKPGKLAELELSIKIVVNEFTKYCERLAQIILSYLKQETFTERNRTKIIPIIFPSLLESEVQDHYLIFYFFGVTITMTWNVITYNSSSNSHAENNSNMNYAQISNNRKESKGISSSSNIGGGNMGGGRGNDEDTKILYGTWDTLKATFKQIDYYQNSAPDNINDKSKVLRVPLTCLIDYCGFRFLCEYDLAGKGKNNETQKTDTKRDFEECKSDSYRKCYNLFCELFYCNETKKDGTFQRNEDNYGGSNRTTFMDNNKNGQGLEKAPYEKLFDIVNDYFSKQDNIGENNLEQKSGPQNKTLFFQTQLKKTQDKNDQTNYPIEYFNINYYEFNNLTEYPRQVSQDNNLLFFNKKTYFRPELISSSTGKDNNFGDQNFAHRNDKEGMENNKTNDEQNQNKLGLFKEKYLNIFNNSLNSFYFKIYDSETLDNLFHSHGINLTSLGYIAEKSESPYVREFCINEMIARTCKKLIFHILAEDRMFSFLDLFEKKPSVPSAPPPFKSYFLPYKYQKLYNKYENKNETKEDSTTSWSYFKHLKEIYLNLGSTTFEEYKFFLSLWGSNPTNQQKNNDETTRNEILNINSVEDKKNPKLMGENEGHNQNKKSTTIIADDHIKRSKELIAKFLNVLFNKTKEKIKIKGKLMNHKELWKFIRTEVGNYYEIESKEILIFCKLNCMSLPPFLDAFEYHTGIKLDWGKVKDEKANKDFSQSKNETMNQKNNDQSRIFNYYPENKYNNYTNRHLLSITWKPEDVLEITPKTKTFSFSFFVSNDKEKNEEYICNYSQLIINRNLTHVENFDKFMLLRFFYEKINKTNNFTLWYVIYFNQLKYDILENVKENKDIKTEQDKNSRDSDSNKEEKTNKNLVYNKNNECIYLYKYIFDELKKSEQANKNTRYDLTGLLFSNEDINQEEEINNNKNITCSLYMQKKFSRLGYIMLNLTKEILSIEEKNTNLSRDDKEKSQSLLAANTMGDMSGNNNINELTINTKRKKEENSKDMFVEVKKLDGEHLFHIETNIKYAAPFENEKQALQLIENFYIKDHPYYCDIKELCGKELLTKWKATHNNRKELEADIENYFNEAIRAGLKCLPVTNIYLANLSLDVGSFYAARNDYLNAVKIFIWAYSPFKINSQYFQKDYQMYLKRFIKYNIKLGDFRSALTLGEELLKENQNSRNEKDGKVIEYLNKNLHLERIRYNLALVALKVKDYEKGLKHCQNIFENKEQSNNNANDSSSNSNTAKKRKTEYINWQVGKENDYPGKNLPFDKDYEEKLKNQEYHIKLKLYMKMIIRSLNVEAEKENKKEYLQAILRFYDSAEEKQSIKEEKRDLEEIKLALQGSGNLKDYFKTKIISALKIKNRAEDNTNDKTQMKEKEQQNSDYELFKKLFSYFENDKVFHSFNRKENKNENENKYDDNEEREEDEMEGKQMRGGDRVYGEENGDEDNGEDMEDEEGSINSKGYIGNKTFGNF